VRVQSFDYGVGCPRNSLSGGVAVFDTKSITRKKKILLVIPSLAGGGAEMIMILKYLDYDIFLPILVVFNNIGEYCGEIPSSVPIVELNKRNKLDFFKLIFKLRALIKKEKPDILFSMLNYANFIAVIATFFLRLKPKIVLSERNDPNMHVAHSNFSYLVFLLIKFTYKYANKIIVISGGIKDALIKNFMLIEDRIVVIYNPLDIEKVKKLCNENVSDELFKNKAKTIIAVGRLSKQKNYGLLLNAFCLARENLSDLQLIILGQGELEEQMKTLAIKLKINNCVHFLGFKKNPFPWIKRSDVFVLSSIWEGFGNVITEAMACGVPVISTDCASGPNEIITSGKNGILVPVDDVLEFAKVLEALNVPALSNAVAEAYSAPGQDTTGTRGVQQAGIGNLVPAQNPIPEDLKDLNTTTASPIT